MSTELKSLLNNQLSDILKRYLSSKGETNSVAIDKAIDLVLPTVIAGILAHVNGSKDKAMNLYNKIMDDKSELHGAIQHAIQTGQIAPSITELGEHFSNAIFGSQASVVAAHIGKESGVSDESAGHLLSSSLPLVLSVLRQQSWSPAALYQILSNQSAWLSKLPAGIMIALGIGSTAGLSASVAALASTLSGYVATTTNAALGASTATGAALTGITGSTAASSGGFAWGKLLLWLGLGVLAILGLRMCMNQASNTSAKQPNSVVAASAEQSGESSGSLNGDSANQAASEAGSQTDSQTASQNSDDAAKSGSQTDSQTASQNSDDAAKSGSQTDSQTASQNSDDAAKSGSQTDSQTASQNNDDAAKSGSQTDSQTASQNSDDAAKSDSQTDSGSLKTDKASSDSSKNAPAANESRAVAENGLVKFYFATGFSRIAKNADEVAQEAIEAGKAGKKLIISGFTDSTGKAKANEALSRKRAEAVKKFFVERGVSEENIELRKPKNSVGAKGESQEGRRVEVQIKD